MRKLHRRDKDTREERIDGGDDNLSPHDGGEAAIKGGEALGYLLAAERIEVVSDQVFFAIKFQLRIYKEANSDNATDDEEDELSSCAPGELSEAGQVTNLAFDGIRSDLLQAVVIGER